MCQMPYYPISLSLETQDYCSFKENGEIITFFHVLLTGFITESQTGMHEQRPLLAFAQIKSIKSRLLRASSSWVLSIPKDGDSTASLFQCFITLGCVKRIILFSCYQSHNFLCFKLSLLPFILLLYTFSKGPGSVFSKHSQLTEFGSHKEKRWVELQNARPDWDFRYYNCKGISLSSWLRWPLSEEQKCTKIMFDLRVKHCSEPCTDQGIQTRSVTKKSQRETLLQTSFKINYPIFFWKDLWVPQHFVVVASEMALCPSRCVWFVLVSADPLRNADPLKTGWCNESKPKTE